MSLLAAVVLLVISSGSVAQGKLNCVTAVHSLHNNYSYYCSKKCWHNGIIGLSSFFAVNLPFIELGRTAGIDGVTLPALNDGLSGVVDIPIGFALGNSTQTVVYVSAWPSQSMHHRSVS